MANNFDVWLVAADTVYKGVPFGVVTGWAEQGRLGADDKLRPAGVNSPWVRAADHPLISDYLYEPPPATAPVEPHGTGEPLFDPDPEPTAAAGVAAPPTPIAPSAAPAPFEPLDVEFTWRKKHDDEDDEVDMIPLIDVSLVLLIFFMLTSSVSSTASVPVPEMKHSAQLRGDPKALTVQVDKRASGEVIYALAVGESVAPEDRNLTSVAAVVSRLKARVAESDKPEVRIACNKDLPRLKVREVAKELDKLKKDGKIAFYGAEVGELK